MWWCSGLHRSAVEAQGGFEISCRRGGFDAVRTGRSSGLDADQVLLCARCPGACPKPSIRHSCFVIGVTFPNREIASVLATTESAAESLLVRARKTVVTERQLRQDSRWALPAGVPGSPWASRSRTETHAGPSSSAPVGTRPQGTSKLSARRFSAWFMCSKPLAVRSSVRPKKRTSRPQYQPR